MGWAVGWDPDHRRHRGYGVPAWCDAYGKAGCREEIDRGLGHVCEAHIDPADTRADDEQLDPLEHTIFVCSQHTCADVDEDNLPPEHPEWVVHVLADPSWEKWRAENPDIVKVYQELMVAGIRAAQDKARTHG